MSEKAYNDEGQEIAVKKNYDFDPVPPMCSYPHGKQLSIVTAAIATIGFLMNVATNRVCNFVDRKSEGSSMLDGVEVQIGITRSFGVWTFTDSDDNSCYKYPNELNLATELEVAQAFGIISAILGGMSMLFLFSFACNIWLASYRNACAAMLITAVISLGMVFIIFGSSICNNSPSYSETNLEDFSSECVLSTGGILAIVGMCHYFVAALLTLRLPDGEIPE